MHIIVIKPLHPDLGINYFDQLPLHTLRSITPEKHKLEVKYFENDNIKINNNFDIVLINSTTSYASFAYELADEFRKKGVPVVLGGWHASVLPEEAKGHADAVVVGEAEESWPRLLRDFENGEMKPFYRQTKPVDIFATPIPKPEHISSFSKKYILEATRGCPVSCRFCTLGNTDFASTFRIKPVQKIIEEIRPVKKSIFFIDASLTINLDYTKQLFEKMRELNKKFSCYGDVDTLSKDDELLMLAKNAGCRQWHIGFESINQKNLEEIGKNVNHVKKYEAAVRNIHDHGMAVVGNFIFGFDNDTQDVFDKTLKTIYSLEIDAAEFNVLIPLPGTPLYNKLDVEGRILTKDWSKYTYGNVVFKPKNMSQQELLDGYKKVINDFYSTSNMLKRYFRIIKKFETNIFLLCIITNYNMKKFYKMKELI